MMPEMLSHRRLKLTLKMPICREQGVFREASPSPDKTYVTELMSELARNEHGEEWTAFRLRDAYRTAGTRFRWFVCAYCDTEVTPSAVYGFKFKVPPYFRIVDKDKPHATQCPYGKASFASYGIVRAVRKNNPLNVDLPERLVAILPRRVEGAALNRPPSDLASPEEVRRRVRAGAAAAAITNQYTTGILETLLDARKSAVDAICKLPNIVSATGTSRYWKDVYRELSKFPLNLYGTQLDYNAAFRRIPRSGSYIYQGQATVIGLANGFRLQSINPVPASRPDEPARFMQIDVICNPAAPRNRMERRTTLRLSQAANEGRSVYWNAYGAFSLELDAVVHKLVVDDPYHISVSVIKK